MEAFLALLAALPAFIQALPYMFQVALKVILVIEKFMNWAAKNNFNQWLNEVEVTIDKLQNAKTSEEKAAAAHSIGDLIRKLG